MFRILIGVVVAAAVLIEVAARFLPWWGVSLLVLALAAAARYVLAALLGRLARLVAQTKSSGLRGAAAEVLAISPMAPQGWFAVELEITPADTMWTGFWDPGELALTRPGRTLEDDDHEAADVQQVELFVDGAWRQDRGETVQGAQRVRLTAALREGVAAATLRYYFEDLATLDLASLRAS